MKQDYLTHKFQERTAFKKQDSSKSHKYYIDEDLRRMLHPLRYTVNLPDHFQIICIPCVGSKLRLTFKKLDYKRYELQEQITLEGTDQFTLFPIWEKSNIEEAISKGALLQTTIVNFKEKSDEIIHII